MTEEILSGPVLRNPLNLDFATAVVLCSLCIQVVAKYAFHFEYKVFTRHEKKENVNTFLVYIFSNISYLLLLSLLFYPLLQEYFLLFFPDPWQLFALCFFAFVLLVFFKIVIKAIWISSFEQFDDLIDNLGEKAYLSYWKYLVCLAFIVVFYYSPLRIYFEPVFTIYLFLGLYLLDVVYEFLNVSNFNISIGLYKFLYLCTLEILPVLVFLKLLFIL